VITIQPAPRLSIDFTMPAPGMISPGRDLDRAARTFDESDPVVNITDNPVRNQLRMSLRVFKRRLRRRTGKLRLFPGGRLTWCRGGAD
jgi:hypothetical protein